MYLEETVSRRLWIVQLRIKLEDLVVFVLNNKVCHDLLSYVLYQISHCVRYHKDYSLIGSCTNFRFSRVIVTFQCSLTDVLQL